MVAIRELPSKHPNVFAVPPLQLCAAPAAFPDGGVPLPKVFAFTLEKGRQMLMPHHRLPWSGLQG